MAKILMVFRVFEDEESTKGIFNKIQSQCLAVEQANHEVDKIWLTKSSILLNGKVIYSLSKVLPSPWLIATFYGRLKHLLQDAFYDKVFIRHTPIAPRFNAFLYQLKQTNHQCKIYLEIPTFPFQAEYHGWKRYLLWAGGPNTTSWPNLLEAIVHYGPDAAIYGVKTIQISNGVNLAEIPLRAKSMGEDNALELIAIGALWAWQGIDRVLYGMANYKTNKPQKVHLTIIGDGSERQFLAKLIHDLGLEDQVTMVASCYGDALIPYVDKAQLGLGKLGIHRIGLDYSSALKHRNYAARGLPFVYAGSDKDFEGQHFVCQVAADDSPIDIGVLFDFADRTKNIPPSSIRGFAEKDLSWQSQLKFLNL